MFAIEFNEDNLPKILKSANLTVGETEQLCNLFITREYVFINGYYDTRNRLQDWAILPKFVFVHSFVHDPETVKTDWDQIVRM